MSSSFEKVVSGVDVFEVGYYQAKELLEDSSNTCKVRLGAYVIVGATSAFGMPVDGVYAFDGYDTLDATVDYVLHSDSEHLDFLRESESKFGYVHEVWHIVDDGDLWQAWDYDSARACREGGQPTDYHVYAGNKCVLDLVREVPSTLYVVTVVDGADQIVSADWYADADRWADAVSFANVNGNRFMSLEHQTAGELGVYVVDDWDRDEGLADGVAVLNAYYRDYRSE